MNLFKTILRRSHQDDDAEPASKKSKATPSDPARLPSAPESNDSGAQQNDQPPKKQRPLVQRASDEDGEDEGFSGVCFSMSNSMP